MGNILQHIHGFFVACWKQVPSAQLTPNKNTLIDLSREHIFFGGKITFPHSSCIFKQTELDLYRI